MTYLKLAAATALALSASTAGANVTLSPNGHGQGLLFPYFTTNNGQSSLISLQNHTAQGKALKVRVLESHAGKETLTFNIYVAPHAQWTASLNTDGDDPDAPASIQLVGPGCSAPRLDSSGHALVDYGYTGDTGPQGLERTREGSVEIIEMGTLSDALSANVTAGTAAGCDAFTARFESGGAWETNANTDLSAPTGGLSGNAMLIDVSDGTSFGYAALAFDGLANVARQAPLAGANADYYGPRLTDINTGMKESIEVDVLDQHGQTVTLRYAADDGVQAIGALLASASASGTFETAPGLAARTEWVVSFPTFAANRARATTVTPPAGFFAPFTHAPVANAGETCESVPLALWKSDGSNADTLAPLPFCGATSVLAFNYLDAANPANAPVTAPIFVQDGDVTVSLDRVSSGSATLRFDTLAGSSRRSRPDLANKCWAGLPAWVWQVSAYDNANAQAGRIATFPETRVATHRLTVADCDAIND